MLNGIYVGGVEGRCLVVPRKEHWVNEYQSITTTDDTILTFHNLKFGAENCETQNLLRRLHMVELREGEEIIDV